MASRRLQEMSSRRLQRDNFSSSKTFWRRLEYVFKISCEMSSRRICKTSSRRLGRRKIVTLKTCWRRLQHVLKTSWRPTNVCWVCSFCWLYNETSKKKRFPVLRPNFAVKCWKEHPSIFAVYCLLNHIFETSALLTHDNGILLNLDRMYNRT